MLVVWCSRSYEARQFGVHSAMPSFEAVANVLPSFRERKYALYTRESRRVFEIFKGKFFPPWLNDYLWMKLSLISRGLNDCWVIRNAGGAPNRIHSEGGFACICWNWPG
ncbi:MAG: hypothetical protein CM1200mP18_22380 [Gammaproteobacteria bacterium]|nr:MAG: hypothetical protein CM1200mP18_22380 [Gammaproteobacteria bacterium]